jgi:hypothetical protein
MEREQLIELEPRLAELMEEAKQVKNLGGLSLCASQTCAGIAIVYND